MATSGTQRSPWLVTLIVAIIGALGVIGAAVLPKLLDHGTTTNPATHINKAHIEAESAFDRSGDMQLWNDQGVAYLSYITVGAWAVYEGERLGAGEVRSITARVASATEGGNIDIRLDGASGRLIGRCSVPNTGGWSSWRVIQCDIVGKVPSRPSQIHLGFSGTSTPEKPYLFNLDWVDLS